MSSTNKHRRVRVLLPLAIGDVYDYRASEDMGIVLGQFVTVPLGRREITGVVWEEALNSDFPEARMKDILDILPSPILPDDSRTFVDWVAKYTMQRRGRVLRMAMSVPDALYPKPPRTGYRFTGQQPDKLTPARKRVLEIAAEGSAFTAADLSNLAAVSSSVVKGLATQAVLERVHLPSEKPVMKPDWQRPGSKLSMDQDAAAKHLV
ncbi:MAG: hypothetical protein V7701_01390, partial [Sneathiella sp.]